MCCHSVDSPHYAEDERSNCCHVHAEDLPANNVAPHEGSLPPEGWTVQNAYPQFLAEGARPSPLGAAVPGTTVVEAHEVVLLNEAEQAWECSCGAADNGVDTAYVHVGMDI